MAGAVAGTEPAPARRGRPGLAVAAPLLGVALLAWVVAAVRMRGMDAGPGTGLGALGWYTGVWVTMMAAMMLPSAAPMILLVARVAHAARERGRRGGSVAPTWIFVGGYLAVWTAFGLVAYGVDRLVVSLAGAALAWSRSGPAVAGAAIAAAGLYELTPLKAACLRHCRGPAHYVLGGWRGGRLGAVRMGLEHGAYCAGCCAGLMLALFALGVMSLAWTAAVAAIVAAQKLLPGGAWARRLAALVLVALGVWVAAAPSSVPWLVEPHATMSSARAAPVPADA